MRPRYLGGYQPQTQARPNLARLSLPQGTGAASPQPHHACPVRIVLSAAEVEALARGDERTFVMVSGTNNCGQAIQVAVQRGPGGVSIAGTDAEVPFSDLPPFSDYPED